MINFTVKAKAVVHLNIYAAVKTQRWEPVDRAPYAQAKHHKLKLLHADRALIAFGTTVIAKL